jgi:hypothetical protein
LPCPMPLPHAVRWSNPFECRKDCEAKHCNRWSGEVKASTERWYDPLRLDVRDRSDRSCPVSEKTPRVLQR